MKLFFTTTPPRATRIVLFTITALLFILFAASLRVSATAVAAPEKTRNATVIVQFDSIDIAAREITFETKKISGLAALKRTGLQVVTTETQFGTAVCSIAGVGQPANDCFGDPQGQYWSYNYWDGTQWQGYEVGAGSSQVGAGAIEGWRWGNAFPAVLKPAPNVLSALKGLTWLQKQQSATDGGYGGAAGTTNTQLAIAANELKANKWKRNSTAPSLQAFQTQNAKPYTKLGAAEAGKLAIAISGSSSCFPKNTKTPSAYYNSGTGAYAASAGAHAFGMLGTAALAQEVPDDAVAYLNNLQKPDGGWEWQPTWGTDTNTTALALQALIAAGEPNDTGTVVAALEYLALAQNEDGGFPYDPAATEHPSDGSSTAWVVQGLIAVGENPADMDWTPSSDNPFDFLLSLQLNNGSFRWQPTTGSNVLTTQQIIPALLGRPYIFDARAYKECKQGD